MASYHLRSVDGSATLSTTELVHESYLKLHGTASADWEGRAHFFGAASRAMRQVLVDFARRRGAAKRGGEATRVSLGEDDAVLQPGRLGHVGRIARVDEDPSGHGDVWGLVAVDVEERLNAAAE